MVKIDPTAHQKSTISPSQKGETKKSAQFITIPMKPSSTSSKDYSQNIFSFESVLEPYMSTSDKTKSNKETIIPNTWEASKKTGLSKNFIDRLARAEGYKTEAYRCEAGFLTIGYGHNIDADPNYKYGHKITEDVAIHLFTKDLINAQKALKNMLGGQKLKQHQEEALVDIIFNMGVDSFSKTKLLQLVKEKKFNEVPKEMCIVKAGKKVSAGLCLRRLENISRFCGKNPSVTAIKTMQKIQSLGIAASARKRGKGLVAKIKQRTRVAFFKIQSDSLLKKSLHIYNANHPGNHLTLHEAKPAAKHGRKHDSKHFGHHVKRR